MINVKKMQEALEAAKKAVQDAETEAGRARIEKLFSEINALGQSYFDKVAAHEKVIADSKEAEKVAEQFSSLAKKVSGDQSKVYLQEAKSIRRQLNKAVDDSKKSMIHHCGMKFSMAKKSFGELSKLVDWVEHLDQITSNGFDMIQLILEPSAHYKMIAKPKVANNDQINSLAKKFNRK